MANEDLLWGPCKRTCQTGYLLFSLWFAFMVVHVVLSLIATCVSGFESCWTYLRILILWSSANESADVSGRRHIALIAAFGLET